MSEFIKVSVVIPFYNNETHITECLEKVCRQSLQEIEIILINNNSSDKSRGIVEGFRKKDSRIKVTNETVQGAGPARNRGLRLAKGEYVIFLDGDDCYPDVFILEKLYGVARKHNKQVVRGNYLVLNPKGDLTRASLNGLGIEFFQEREVECMLGESMLLSFFWGHSTNLIRRDFLVMNKIEYPSFLRGEDSVFLAKVYFCLKEAVLWLPDVVLHYRNESPDKWNFRQWPDEKLVGNFNSFLAIRKLMLETGNIQMWHCYQLSIFPKINLLLERVCEDKGGNLYGLFCDIMRSVKKEDGAHPDVFPFNQKPLERFFTVKKALESRVETEGPFFSVIVPVYNAGRFLRECLDSIVTQSFKDFELILINDGSTDNSLEICQDYAKRDSRIFIINQENNGSGSARNRGLEVARGEYIQFIDSDDYLVDDTCMADISTYLERLNIDILYFQLESFPANSPMASKYDNYYTMPFRTYGEGLVEFSRKEFPKHLRKCTASPVQKVYRREKIINLRFIEGKLANDDEGFHVLVHAQDLLGYLLPRRVYGRRVHESSISGQLRQEQNFQESRHSTDIFEVLKHSYTFLEKRGDCLETLVACYSRMWIIGFHRTREYPLHKVYIEESLLNLSEDKPLLAEQDFNGNIKAYELYRELLFCDYDALVRWVRRESFDCMLDKDSLIENYDKALRKVSEANRKTTDERNQVRLDRDKAKADRDKIRLDRDKIKADRDKIRLDRDKTKAERDHVKADRDDAHLARDKIKAERDQINADRWYAFGQLSRKGKIWKIGKIICLRLRIYKILRPLAVSAVNKIKKR